MSRVPILTPVKEPKTIAPQPQAPEPMLMTGLRPFERPYIPPQNFAIPQPVAPVTRAPMSPPRAPISPYLPSSPPSASGPPEPDEEEEEELLEDLAAELEVGALTTDIVSPESLPDDVPIPELGDDQIPHFEKIVEILGGWHAYDDTSVTGSGKTYVTCAVAKRFNLKLFVVAPSTIHSKWREVGGLYRLEIVELITYESLRGTNKYQPNTRFLMRRGSDFYATQDFRNLLAQGILLVFDEAHKLKNASDQREAAAALVGFLVAANNMRVANCRVALLSATPGDKVENAISLVRLLGITEQKKMYEFEKTGFGSGEYRELGLADLRIWCERQDPFTAATIFNRHISRNTVKNIIYDAFINIVAPRLVSAMPPPDINLSRDAKNGYYWLSPEDSETLGVGIAALGKAVRYQDGNIKITKNSFGAITKALILIEQAKTPLMIRLARKILTENPHAKVLLYFNYLENIKKAEAALTDYNPLVMVGKDKREKRDKSIAAFEADDDVNRLFISNPHVGSMGIDLDDKFGTRPRHMFIMPDYRFIPILQAMGRVFRRSTKSMPIIRLVYGQGPHVNETSIINSMFKKSSVAKALISAQTSLPFPADLENEFEEEPGGASRVSPPSFPPASALPILSGQPLPRVTSPAKILEPLRSSRVSIVPSGQTAPSVPAYQAVALAREVTVAPLTAGLPREPIALSREVTAVSSATVTSPTPTYQAPVRQPSMYQASQVPVSSAIPRPRAFSPLMSSTRLPVSPSVPCILEIFLICTRSFRVLSNKYIFYRYICLIERLSIAVFLVQPYKFDLSD